MLDPLTISPRFRSVRLFLSEMFPAGGGGDGGGDGGMGEERLPYEHVSDARLRV